MFELKGHFADRIISFLEYKRALGYLYKEEEKILRRFDCVCAEEFPNEKNLTREVVFKISEHRGSESGWTQNKRIHLMREFAKYLGTIGEQAFVMPGGLVKEPQKYIPHIYTKEELSVLFQTIDKRGFNGHFPLSHLTMPVI